MTIREHADRTESLLGHRAEDIHRWIDRYFDAEGFADFLRDGFRPGYDPYAHRRHRHCREALADARREFEGQYPPDLIDAVVERHIRDDYDGYFPYREDFEKGDFREKYHEGGHHPVEAGHPADGDLAAYFRGRYYDTSARHDRRGSRRFLWRFLLPVSVSLVLLIGALFAVVVPLSRNNLMEQKKQTVRELTAVALGALEHYAAHVPPGLMTEEEARYEAAEEIRRMRYGTGGKEYYWIIDSHPRMVMHPYREELEGSDLSGYRDREDAAGVYLFREAAAIAASDGEGFISYRWQHWDDPAALAPKLSFVRYFPEWDWIVGTGIYIDDVEREIDELLRRLGTVSGIIVLVSALLMTWVLAGALRVERRRGEAEEGLRETKERYRALAEASTEGYMLVAGGVPLYVNPALCRITGRSEEDLLEGGPGGLLDSGASGGEAAAALQALSGGEAPSGTWTVSLAAGGSLVEATLGISRIFLPGSNGHIVSVRRPLTAGDRMDAYAGPASQTAAGSGAADRSGPAAGPGGSRVPQESITAKLRLAGTRLEVLEAVGELGPELSAKMAAGAGAAQLRRMVADVYDAALARLADLAAGRLPIPGGSRAAILSLGSNARREMTPFSDQDGAMVFSEVPGVPLEDTRNAWLSVAADIAEGLEAAGFPRCDGGVMPMNPRWCLSIPEWKERIDEWASAPRPAAMMEMNILLDRRPAWGDRELSTGLDGLLGSVRTGYPGLVRLYREHSMLFRPPSPGRRRRLPVDLKEALKPLETQLRLLALVHDIPAVGSLERLEALRGAGVLDRGGAMDLRMSFETFWRLRFRLQLEGHRQPVRSDDAVNPVDLPRVERAHLMAALEAVDDFVRRRGLEISGN